MTHKLKSSKILLYFIRIILAIFYLLPIYLLVVTSLKHFADVNFARMWLPPNYISFESFGRALVKLGPNIKNSFAMVIPGTILSALVGSINGYIFSKQRFSGSNLIFILLLFGMFIPYQSIIIPMVYLLQRIAINGKELVSTLPPTLQFLNNLIPGYGSIAGLVLVHVIYGIPLMSLIFRNYYSVVPNEMIEASRLDGAGVLGIYRYIIFPISIPGFVVAIIWQFTSLWNEFLFAVILISSPAKRPLMVALYSLQGSHITEWNVQMAGALLAALPPLLIYLALGRYFLRGLLAGSLKG
jgi:glucose/mannose transport system permease protein